MNFGEESKVCSAATAIGEAEKSPPFPLLPVLGIFYVHTDVFIVHSLFYLCSPAVFCPTAAQAVLHTAAA